MTAHDPLRLCRACTTSDWCGSHTSNRDGDCLAEEAWADLDPDPLHVEGPPDLTDVATHATGWYLTVLVVVAAALLVAIYGVTRT